MTSKTVVKSPAHWDDIINKKRVDPFNDAGFNDGGTAASEYGVDTSPTIGNPTKDKSGDGGDEKSFFQKILYYINPINWFASTEQSVSDDSSSGTSSAKKGIIVGSVIAVAIALVYFTFFYGN